MDIKQTGKRMTPEEAAPDADRHLIENYGTIQWMTTNYVVVTINPKEWYKNAMKGDITIQEAYRRLAKPWQRELVKGYKAQAKNLAATTYLLIDGENETVEDGYHRLVAYALAGITEAHALDLSQEAECLDNCIHCGCYVDSSLGKDRINTHYDRTGHYSSARAPGDQDNVCDDCNYKRGLQGGTDVPETYAGNYSEWNDPE